LSGEGAVVGVAMFGNVLLRAIAWSSGPAIAAEAEAWGE
jgi:hypothetical protein